MIVSLCVYDRILAFLREGHALIEALLYILTTPIHMHSYLLEAILSGVL